MSLPWFRMYAEFATDPKVQRLSEADQRRFVMLLCLRCSNGDVTLHDEDVAFQLRISDEEWATTKRVLIAKNLITGDSEPVAWEKRQMRSDSSAARVSEHRAKKKAECNGDVTLQKRSSNGLDLDVEGDTDTEKDKTLTEADASVTQELTLVPENQKPPLSKPSTAGARVAKSGPNPDSIATWGAFAHAYRDRYGVDPVRNAKVNGQIKNLVQRLGGVEAPSVASWYVRHNGQLYVRGKHPVDLLLRDCEGLRTEWARGQQVTEQDARHVDRKQATVNAFGPLIAEAEAREAEERKHAV